MRWCWVTIADQSYIVPVRSHKRVKQYRKTKGQVNRNFGMATPKVQSEKGILRINENLQRNKFQVPNVVIV